MSKSTSTPKTLSIPDIVKGYNKMKTQSGGGAGFIKLNAGENIVRLVTFINEKENREELYVDFVSNFVPSAKESFVNPITIGERNSPISNYAKWLEHKEGRSEIVNRIRDKNRAYFLGIQGNQYKVLEAPVTLATSILAIFANEDYGNIADPKTGREIKISKLGSGLDTEYEALPRPKISPVPPNVEGQRIDLRAFMESQIKSYDELVKVVENNFNVDYSEIEEWMQSGAVSGTSEYEPKYEESFLQKKSVEQLKKLPEAKDFKSNWDKKMIIKYLMTGLPF